MNYTKTNWENDITPVSAENMNKIENQLKALTDAMYPVGSIYISVKSTNPSSFFGGTWTAFGTGKTLVGIDTSDTNFDTVEKFESYMRENLPSHYELTYSNYSEENDTKIQEVVFKDMDSDEQKTLNIIMKLKEGTDFVMSFSIK